jgi:hypothetical protein
MKPYAGVMFCISLFLYWIGMFLVWNNIALPFNPNPGFLLNGLFAVIIVSNWLMAPKK